MQRLRRHDRRLRVRPDGALLIQSRHRPLTSHPRNDRSRGWKGESPSWLLKGYSRVCGLPFPSNFLDVSSFLYPYPYPVSRPRLGGTAGTYINKALGKSGYGWIVVLEKEVKMNTWTSSRRADEHAGSGKTGLLWIYLPPNLPCFPFFP